MFEVHIHQGSRWSRPIATREEAEAWAERHAFGSAYTIHERAEGMDHHAVAILVRNMRMGAHAPDLPLGPDHRGHATRSGTTSPDPAIQPACRACTVELRADGTCPSCAALPADQDYPAGTLCAVLETLVHPDSTEEERDEALDTMLSFGRVEVESFAEAGILTDDLGFVLTVGRAQFQITIVRTR